MNDNEARKHYRQVFMLIRARIIDVFKDNHIVYTREDIDEVMEKIPLRNVMIRSDIQKDKGGKKQAIYKRLAPIYDVSEETVKAIDLGRR